MFTCWLLLLLLVCRIAWEVSMLYQLSLSRGAPGAVTRRSLERRPFDSLSSLLPRGADGYLYRLARGARGYGRTQCGRAAAPQ